MESPGQSESQKPWFDITELAETVPLLKGLDLSTVEKGDFICFPTRNSVYVFKVDKPASLDKNNPELCRGMIFGGYFERKFKAPVDHVEIAGSTWGGSALVPNQIKENMRVELIQHFGEPGSEDYKSCKRIVTSPVKGCKLIKPPATHMTP